MSSVSVKKITKRFPRLDRAVLTEVSFDLAPGSFTALLGASGSGKSTLIHLLAGLDTPDTGEISIFETPISSCGDDERSDFRLQKIGIVFQFFQLLPALSARQNAELPGRLQRKLPISRIDELFKRFGLSHRQDALPHELSGGELQRVALIRALCNSPLLVLADEPTGNLDSAAGSEVIKLFRALCDEEKITLFVATHDRDLAAKADRILQLVDGCLR